MRVNMVRALPAPLVCRRFDMESGPLHYWGPLLFWRFHYRVLQCIFLTTLFVAFRHPGKKSCDRRGSIHCTLCAIAVKILFTFQNCAFYDSFSWFSLIMDKDYAPLSASCVRALNDKLYEKRKVAALEIERFVKLRENNWPPIIW